MTLPPNQPKRFQIATTNVLSHALSNFKNLNENDKAVIRTFILFLVLLVVAGIACALLFPESQIAIVLTAVFSSTAVSAIYSIFDRLSVLSPVENRISQAIADLRAVIVELNANGIERADRNEALIAKFREATQDVDSYGKYAIVRHNFGLNTIAGRICVHKSSKTYFETANLIVERLEEAKLGDEICYLTSYVEDARTFTNAVMDAVARGVSIKLMLMYPDEEAEVVISRWRDVYDSSHASRSVFVEHIKFLAQKILWTRNDLKEISDSNDKPGGFHVRFYTKSLNFPLILTSSGSISGTAGSVAYTGFYANCNAEEMPYIEWRGGAFQIVERFKSMFDEKWKDCHELQDLDKL